MADEGEDDTVVMRHPKRSVSSEQSQRGQMNDIPMKEQRKSKQQEGKSHVIISMDNAAYTSSQNDLNSTEHERDTPNKLFRAVAQNRYEECKSLLDRGLRVNSVDDTDGSTVLHSLAKKAVKGDDRSLKIASLLINRGAELDANDKKHNTPLHIAAREGLCKICEVIINQAEVSEKSVVNRLNEKSMTPLHLAAQEGQCEVVELLLRRGAIPNMKDYRAWFPIHFAVNKGCVKCCKALASHYRGDAALAKNQEALLIVAAKKGYYNVCKEFPAEKLGVDYKDKDHNTALHIAAKIGFYKFVNFLLDLGASPDLPNYWGYTALMAAVVRDQEKCVTALVCKGASLIMKSIDGSNVLHIAASNKSNKCMAYLLKYNDVKNLINEKDKEGFTPLILAVQKKSNKCLKLLEDAGACSIVGNEDRASVIYYSPNYRGSLIIQEMLQQEKNVNLTNEDKQTPLHIAAREGSIEACKSLLRKGARINVSDKDGRTPLHWASIYGHHHTLKLFLKNGASRRTKDDKQFTALHWAAFGGKLECCKVLLDTDRGLMKEKDKRGKYALDIAFQQGRFDVFTFLLNFFSQRTRQIPEGLADRFHSYVHTMLRDKKRALLDAVIKSNWWETGFGATEKKFHDKEACSQFKEMIKMFPDLASDIMTKCYSKQNFRLLEDNYCMQNPKETSDTIRMGSLEEIVQVAEDNAISSNLNWKLHHPVSTMVSRKCLDLLQHPLVKAWVRYKWRAYAGMIFMIVMAIRAFSIAILVWFLCSIRNTYQMNEQIEELQKSTLAVPPLNLLMMLIAFILQLMVDVNSCWRLRLKENSTLMVFELLGLLLTFVALVLTYTCDTNSCNDKLRIVYMFGIVALVLEGLHFIFILDLLPIFNVLTSISRTFIQKYLKGIFCVTCIVILFAFIFHLLFWKDQHFKTMAESILSIALWQWGDFNQEVFFEVEAFRMFSHILFIIYLFTFGALIVTIIQAPSIEREVIELNKETCMINLLFEIDVSFPMLRRVCEGSQSTKTNPEKVILGLRKSCEEKKNEVSVDEAAFMRNKSQRCKSGSESEKKEWRAMHVLLMENMNGLRHDLKNLQNQIHLLQRKTLGEHI